MRTLQQQKQKASFSQQMQMNLHLLSMPALELQKEIEQAVLENPVLETPVYSEVYVEGDAVAHEAMLENVSAIVDELVETLLLQLHVSAAPQALIRHAERIVFLLDDAGYVRMSVRQLAQALGLSEAEAKCALRLVQGCEPCGIGARSLRECLYLQLGGDDRIHVCARILVKYHLEALGTADLSQEGFSREETAAAKALIRSLNPKPGLSLDRGAQIRCMPAEILVEKENGALNVSLINQPAMPGLSKAYAKCDRGLAPEARAYLADCKQKARRLFGALAMRKNTLLAVAQCICDRQRSFFLYGEAPVHLTQQTVGELTGRHASTISRAALGKLLEFDGHVYPLAFFFPACTSGGSSAAQIKAEMQRLLTDHETRLLTDQQISDRLQLGGMYASRRTVGKYRVEMGVESTRKRALHTEKP